MKPATQAGSQISRNSWERHSQFSRIHQRLGGDHCNRDRGERARGISHQDLGASSSSVTDAASAMIIGCEYSSLVQAA
jgi:hypothetical protein